MERLRTERSQLLVIDVQERLLPHIDGHQRVVDQIVRVMRAAGELELPVTVSEQYPRGLGSTAAAVLGAADHARVEKMTFSVCRDEGCIARLASVERAQVLLVGIETHVCVQQTALDLLDRDLRPVLLADAVGSRRALDHNVAIERMRQAGVTVTTVESAIYELMERAGTDLFKRMLPVIK